MAEVVTKPRGIARRDSEGFEREATSSLESTFGNFSDRLQRQRKEKSEENLREREAERKRQARLLKAMTTIRRALQETGKIDLGERFKFDLDLQDWQGWPRVELKLVDSVAPEYRSHCFIVTASDVGENAVVRISDEQDNNLAKISLREDQGLRELPVILKKTVRKYLDAVAAYVLDPKKPEELLEVQTRRISLDDEEPEVSSLTSFDEIDVFEEEFVGKSDNQVEEAHDTSGLSGLDNDDLFSK